MNKSIYFSSALLVLPTVAIADEWRTDSTSFGVDTTYFESGSNYVFSRRENFMQGGINFAQRDQIQWIGFDEDDDEPIDEIVVIASRSQIGALFELSAELTFGNMWNQICAHYTDGGHCSHTTNVFNREGWPIAGGCQTISGQTAPLTGSEANSMNLEYQQNRAAVSSTLALGATIGTAIATRGGSALSRLLGAQSDVANVSTSVAVGIGTILATYPDAGDFPFTAGDVVTYTITVCNDGEGGANADLDINIGG